MVIQQGKKTKNEQLDLKEAGSEPKISKAINDDICPTYGQATFICSEGCGYCYNCLQNDC